jgi:hypothetical protein
MIQNLIQWFKNPLAIIYNLKKIKSQWTLAHDAIIHPEASNNNTPT